MRGKGAGSEGEAEKPEAPKNGAAKKASAEA